MRHHFLFVAVLLAIGPTSASGQSAPIAANAEQAFVDRFLNTCFVTSFDYDLIAAQATKEGWAEIDPAQTPFVIKDSQNAIALIKAWNTKDQPAPVMVHAMKFNDPRMKSDCGIAAFDMDGRKVVDLLLADGRFSSNSILPPGVATAVMLNFDKGTILVNWGKAPLGAGGHTSEILIKKF